MNIHKLWYEKHWLSSLLVPLSWIYRAIIFLRRCCYRVGVFKQHKLAVPVIVVGNITVGGTGKTPLVTAIAKYLQAKDLRVGIISRGYGGTIKTPTFVTANSDPAEVGDEPVLLAELTRCSVVVFADRVQAAKTLLAKYPVDVIISDDGLQHYALARDLEINVIDGERRFGNQRLLPAGPLREPLSRLNSVDIKITNGKAQSDEYAMQLVPREIYQLINPVQHLDLNQIAGPIHAIAGIGNPQRFFNTLEKLHLDFIPHPFPDHHQFKADDINFGDDIVIMTAKDAVKCRRFASPNHYCLPIAVSEEAICRLILNKLNSYKPQLAVSEEAI
ncbi:MAG: tetraacyldisaccharide 4'-kinase [Gammaproteobacteria bacterium]|nr:tetraacyldisaccharide 4'-kinase [Gammaproteobacteria bacterium]